MIPRDEIVMLRDWLYETDRITMGGIADINKLLKKYEVSPVVRCKDCLYYHKKHVLCDDGTEKDYSELPPEAFDWSGDFVTLEYGINVGGKCEYEKNSGYLEDKSVYRSENDFCSHGKRKDND